MSIKTPVPKSCRLFVLTAFAAVGCGGSVFSADGSTSAGSAGASAGSAGAGLAGSAAGGAAGASGSGSGGAAGCMAACPLLGCGPGFVAVTQPGECCPSCVPEGEGGAAGSGSCNAPSECAAIACADGFKLAQNPGACCPTCVPDSDACKQDQAGYDSLRQTLLQGTGVLACKTDTDCTRLAGSSQCGDVCSSAPPVNVSSAASINSELSSYAAAHCSTCTPVYASCIVPPPIVCSSAVCVVGEYL